MIIIGLNLGLSLRRCVKKRVHEVEILRFFEENKFRKYWSVEVNLVVFYEIKRPITIDFLEKGYKYEHYFLLSNP